MFSFAQAQFVQLVANPDYIDPAHHVTQGILLKRLNEAYPFTFNLVHLQRHIDYYRRINGVPPENRFITADHGLWFTALHMEAQEGIEKLISLHATAETNGTITPTQFTEPLDKLAQLAVHSQIVFKLIHMAHEWFSPDEDEYYQLSQDPTWNPPAWGSEGHPLFFLGVNAYADVFRLGLTAGYLIRRERASRVNVFSCSLWAYYNKPELIDEWNEQYRLYLLANQEEEERRLNAWCILQSDLPVGVSLRMRFAIHLKHCTSFTPILAAKITDPDLLAHGRPFMTLRDCFKMAARIIVHVGSKYASHLFLEDIMLDIPIWCEELPPDSDEDDEAREEEDDDEDDEDEEEEEEVIEHEDEEGDEQVRTQPPTPEPINDPGPHGVADRPPTPGTQPTFAHATTVVPELWMYAKDPEEVMAMQWMTQGEHPLTFITSITGKKVDNVVVTKSTLTHFLSISVMQSSEAVQQNRYNFLIGPLPSTREGYVLATRKLVDMYERLFWCKIRNRLIMLECQDVPIQPLKKFRYDPYVEKFGEKNLRLQQGDCCCCLEPTTVTVKCPAWTNSRIPHWVCVPCHEIMISNARAQRARMLCPMCMQPFNGSLMVEF